MLERRPIDCNMANLATYWRLRRATPLTALNTSHAKRLLLPSRQKLSLTRTNYGVITDSRATWQTTHRA